MRGLLFVAVVLLFCMANDACCWFGGCRCGGQGTATYSGTMLYTLRAPDGGAPGGIDSGSASLSVTVDSFDPTDTNDLDNSYCGSKSFIVRLGAGCSLTATVTSTGRTGSASIDGGKTCVVSTSTGSLSTPITGGTLGLSGSLLNLVLAGDDATMSFEGSS